MDEIAEKGKTPVDILAEVLAEQDDLTGMRGDVARIDSTEEEGVRLYTVRYHHTYGGPLYEGESRAKAVEVFFRLENSSTLPPLVELLMVAQQKLNAAHEAVYNQAIRIALGTAEQDERG